MSRNYNPIARYVSIDMFTTASKISGMTDEELGRWFRKAVIDCCSGCIDPSADAFVKEQYERSLHKMVQRQEINSKYHKNHTEKTNDQETKISTNDDSSDRPETDTPACTTNLPEVASKSDPIESNKKAYGQNKNVMLTDEEGAHLRELYGEDLKMAIDILDAYIENGGKKAKKYKDHAAVMRRGNWVWNKVQETKLAEKRLENANRPVNLKDFKSMREEEQKRRAFTSLYDKEVL